MMAHLRAVLAKKLREVWCFVKSIPAMNSCRAAACKARCLAWPCMPSPYKDYLSM